MESEMKFKIFQVPDTISMREYSNFVEAVSEVFTKKLDGLITTTTYEVKEFELDSETGYLVTRLSGDEYEELIRRINFVIYSYLAEKEGIDNPIIAAYRY
jgi:hypothetical protein